MKIDIPSFKEVVGRKEQLESSNRTIFQFGHELTPLEKFVYDNEPAYNSDEWRKDLKMAIECAWQHEELNTK